VLVVAGSRRARTAWGGLVALAILVALPAVAVGIVAVRAAFGQDFCVPFLHALSLA
jgi:hypothetical protein